MRRFIYSIGNQQQITGASLLHIKLMNSLKETLFIKEILYLTDSRLQEFIVCEIINELGLIIIKETPHCLYSRENISIL